ncbi:MAG: UDP-N-acetylglucosamine 1-carboxyvinyltransferase [Deltaproteobacteria bacterium]|nr:UDP-N-acetylglucosamine 1-carboxyvinyltransferase [Deltaproteobacteria bacterium]MBW2015635.1 UDP-N-acetylglucosamine 1-carboxyvinyltransferase [Deltaproteobacteria bacterium]MBW2129780.1 UDP-N-acetylglucosamine 1-carboxyvinyltransferase [Deltaproteobacteria bacterium]MBW2302496.1 UDP-N-acetylglucosamine 1-carboxyvinyltransferase [Deltaproteobacteria bacterium]
MDKILIEGGISLHGTVRVSGAKNAALPVIAACILSGGWHRLLNIPRLRDINTIKRIMAEMGVEFKEEDGALCVNTDNIRECEASYDLVKTMRASILLLGPLLARLGRARISMPGGCAIGARPVNLHLKALEAMGVEMFLEHGYINARVEKLKGANILFDIPTVTGTENIMMAAVKAEGESVLENAAREPEVQDLADMLRRMGARIQGDGTDTIVIQGVKELKPVDSHRIIPDRIEAGTFMIASALTKGDILIEGCRQEHLMAVMEKLRAVGAEIEVLKEGLRVKGPETIESVDIRTMPFPGYPTDLQAQFMALMCVARGSSIIKETIFENRFIHVSELRRMGGDIEINGNQALVRGRNHLLAAPVMATDLRASASLVLAGLVARGGRTEINRIYHLDRGYEALEKKFQNLGARIWRVRA